MQVLSGVYIVMLDFYVIAIPSAIPGIDYHARCCSNNRCTVGRRKVSPQMGFPSSLNRMKPPHGETGRNTAVFQWFFQKCTTQTLSVLIVIGTGLTIAWLEIKCLILLAAMTEYSRLDPARADGFAFNISPLINQLEPVISIDTIKVNRPTIYFS